MLNKGATINFMNVYLSMGDRTGVLWRYGQNIGDVWNYAQATITRRFNAENFTLIFEGITNNIQ